MVKPIFDTLCIVVLVAVYSEKIHPEIFHEEINRSDEIIIYKNIRILSLRNRLDTSKQFIS
jgi:hypothetical protein